MSALKIPVVGEYVRGLGKVIAITFNERDGGTDYIFEEVTAAWAICLKGTVIHDCNTLWDFSGRLSSVASAAEEAAAWLKRMDLKPGDANHVRVEMTRKLYRKRPKTDNQDAYCYNSCDREYRDFKALSTGSRWDLPDEQEHIVWDSATSPAYDPAIAQKLADEPWAGLPDTFLPVDSVNVTPGLADAMGSCKSCKRRESGGSPLRVFELVFGDKISFSLCVCQPCGRELMRKLGDAMKHE